MSRPAARVNPSRGAGAIGAARSPRAGVDLDARRRSDTRVSARIEVEELDPETFRVNVVEGASRTTHTVTVEAAYARTLSRGAVSTPELVRRSFEFLLEREPKESILGRFALPVIARYIPEYEREIGRRVAR